MALITRDGTPSKDGSASRFKRLSVCLHLGLDPLPRPECTGRKSLRDSALLCPPPAELRGTLRCIYVADGRWYEGVVLVFTIHVTLISLPRTPEIGDRCREENWRGP